MKVMLSTLLMATGLLSTTLATATTTTLQACSTSGCRVISTTSTSSTYAKTKYPVILAHGMAGWTNAMGLDYWYGIGPDLIKNGATVYETQVASFDSSYVRGEQLRNQVQQILAITGAAKVNIVAHSQGALDSRYVAALMPTRVASVTTVGGVNAPIPIADTVLKVKNSAVGTVFAPLISAGVNAFFSLVGVASGHEYDQNSLAGLNQLATTEMTKFNTLFPAGLPTTACGQGPAVANGIRFYSWGGTGKATNFLDPSDVFLTATGLITSGESDGLVPRCASHLGQVIRDDYYQNHIDEMNHVAGLVSIFTTSPITLYRQQLNRLQGAGL